MKAKKIGQNVSRALSKIRSIDRNKWIRNVSLSLLSIDIILIFVAGSNFLKFVKWAGNNQEKLLNGYLSSHSEDYLVLLTNSLVMVFFTTLILLIILWDFMWKHTKKNGR